MFKNIKTRIAANFWIVLLLMFSSNSAFAGYLTISGESKVTISVEGENVRLSGNYQIGNSGNENAQNVFPSFRFGKWTWAGDARTLAPSSKETWSLDSTFAVDLLANSENELTAVKNLPAKGQIPLFVLRHYEDLNGFRFSVAEVIGAAVGPLNQEELSAIRIPQVSATYKCEGNGKSFSCLLDVRNLTDSSKQVSVSYFTSQELQVKSPPEIIELDSRAQLLLESKVENIGGLQGSGYAVFAVLQWAENNIRHGASVAQVVNLYEPKKTDIFVLSIIIAIIASFSLVYWFVIKGSSGKKVN